MADAGMNNANYGGGYGAPRPQITQSPAEREGYYRRDFAVISGQRPQVVSSDFKPEGPRFVDVMHKFIMKSGEFINRVNS